MELTTLRQFISIADAGHMTRAAETLGVTQPALSSMLKKLEAELGTDLLHRTGRGVELTDAGRAFLEHARASVRRADAGVQAVRELVGLEAGSIRVGGGATATGYILPPLISRLRRDHPGLRFFIREAGSNVVADAVISGELDVGIVTLPVSVAGVSDLMVVTRLIDEFRLITPPDHRLDGDDAFHWADLEGQPVVAFEAGTHVRAVIDAAAQAHGVTLDVVMELRSIESIKRMVAAGIGVGFMSRYALRGDAEGLTCKDGKITRELAFVRRRDRVPSAAAAAFERTLLQEQG